MVTSARRIGVNMQEHSDTIISELQSRISALEEIAAMQYNMLHNVADRKVSIRSLQFIMSDFDYEISDRIGFDWNWG